MPSGSTVGKLIGHARLSAIRLRRRNSTRSMPSSAPRCRAAARERNRPRSGRDRDRSPIGVLLVITSATSMRLVRNAIGPGEHLRDVARGGRTVGADVGALIGDRAAAQRQDRAVAVASDLQLAFGVARVVGGSEMLAAVLDPLHRTAGEARRERDQEVLRIEFAARAEAAADVVLDHADRAFRQAPSASPARAD